MDNKQPAPLSADSPYSDREWKEYRAIENFMSGTTALREAAKQLNMSPSSFAFAVCKYAPAIHKKLQEKTA